MTDADAQLEGKGSTGDVDASGDASANKPEKSRLHRVLVLGACLVGGFLASALTGLIMWLNNASGMKELSASLIVSIAAGVGLLLGLIAQLVISEDSRPNPGVAEIAQAPGRHSKGYRPPRQIDTLDDELAAALTPAQWRKVAHRLRLRRPRHLALRILMFPVIALGTGLMLFSVTVQVPDRRAWLNRLCDW